MRGFTLVELLIVVAVMGIVAALIIGNSFGDKDQVKFMMECSKYEPHYQCEYKWKQMHPDTLWVYHVG